MNEYQLFIQFILTALNEIQSEYFQTEYEHFYAFRGKLKYYGTFKGERFFRHQERSFAYELYFQLRSMINAYRGSHEFFPHHFLQGEIKKMDVYEILHQYSYQSLGAAFVPDLLFHVPSQDANAFVIEIKAQPELEVAEVLYDLDKLAKFLNRFRYRKALFIAVNISVDIIVNFIKNNNELIREIFTEARLGDCHIIVKQYSGNDSPTYNQTLSQILT